MRDAAPFRVSADGSGQHRWLRTVARSGAVAVVGELDDEIVLALRRLDGVTLKFLAREEPEPTLVSSSDDGTEFDVVIVGLGVGDDDHVVDAARALLGPTGTLVVVVSTPETTTEWLENGSGGRELDRLKAQLVLAESRRAAVLDELVAAEQALSEAQTQSRDVVDEISEMRRTVSWRVTRPLRWARSRAAR